MKIKLPNLRKYRIWAYQKELRLRDVHSWYAWYPVCTEDSGVIWLEEVYRQLEVCEIPYFEYKKFYYWRIYDTNRRN